MRATTLALAFLCLATAAGAAPQNVEGEGSGGGAIDFITIRGEEGASITTYEAHGSQLLISQETSPGEGMSDIRELEQDIVDIVAVGQTLYVLHDSNLEIFDIGDPLHPVLHEYVDIPGGGATTLAVNPTDAVGHGFPCIGQNGRVTIVDYSDEEAGPTVKSQLDVTGNVKEVFGWIFDGHQVYTVITGGSAYDIIEFETPGTAPTVLKLVMPPERGASRAVTALSGLCIDDAADRIYMGEQFSPGARQVPQYRVQAYALTGPSSLGALGGIPIDDVPTGLVLGEAQTARPMLRPLYVALFGSVLVVDVSDPAAMTLAAQISVGFRQVFDVVARGNRLYVVVNGLGVRTYDISDPAAPVLLGTRPTPPVRDFVPVGQYAFAACDTYGYYVYDAQRTPDWGAPVAHLDGFFLGSPSFLLPLAPDTILGVQSAGFDIVNVSAPLAPTLVGHFVQSGAEGAALLDANRVVLAGDDTLGVVDITDRANPVGVSTMTLAGSVTRVAVSGSRAFVALNPSGGTDSFSVVDLSDPAAPVLAATFVNPYLGGPFGGISQDIAIEGNTLAVATNGNGVHFWDIANPLAAIHLGADPALATCVGLSGGRAFVGSNAMRVLDISDPANPRVVARASSGGSGVTVRQAGGAIYFSAGNAGARAFSQTTTDPHAVIDFVTKASGTPSALDAEANGVIDIADIVTAGIGAGW